MRGGSDLAADRWRDDYRIGGCEDLDLHHLYRAMAWLGEALPAEQQDDATPFAPRCTKDLIEEQLFAIGAICSAGWTWCSWTPPASTSKASADRASVNTAIAKTIGLTCGR
jgi:hypothetical protein